MDLLKSFRCTNLNFVDEIALKQSVCLFFTLPVDASIAVKKPVQKLHGLIIGKVLSQGSDAFTIFPKSYFTFSNSIITQSDVNQLIDKYNNATHFERVSMQNEPFFKTLMEKGLIKVNTIFDK